MVSLYSGESLTAQLARVELTLPSPGPDMEWTLRSDNPDWDTSKLTVTIRLVSVENGVVVRSARIAVDLYGWSAVVERCRSLLKAELDERYAS